MKTKESILAIKNIQRKKNKTVKMCVDSRIQSSLDLMGVARNDRIVISEVKDGWIESNQGESNSNKSSGWVKCVHIAYA